jgi:hypothetical protein
MTVSKHVVESEKPDRPAANNRRKIIIQDPHDDILGMKRIATNTSDIIWVRVEGITDAFTIEPVPLIVGLLGKAIIQNTLMRFEAVIHTVKVFPPTSDYMVFRQWGHPEINVGVVLTCSSSQQKLEQSFFLLKSSQQLQSLQWHLEFEGSATIYLYLCPNGMMPIYSQFADLQQSCKPLALLLNCLYESKHIRSFIFNMANFSNSKDEIPYPLRPTTAPVVGDGPPTILVISISNPAASNQQQPNQQ